MTWYSMNLQRRKGGVYYFRRAVPEDIQKALGKREIVRSLGTKELPEAKRRAKQFGLEIDQEFDQARSRSTAELSVEEAQQIAELRYQEWLADDAERRIDAERFPHTVEFDPDLLEEFAGKARRALASGDRLVHRVADEAPCR